MKDVTGTKITYEQIQDYVKKKYGYCPKQAGQVTWRKYVGFHEKNVEQKSKRKQPCPQTKIASIKDALLHFGS